MLSDCITCPSELDFFFSLKLRANRVPAASSGRSALSQRLSGQSGIPGIPVYPVHPTRCLPYALPRTVSVCMILWKTFVAGARPSDRQVRGKVQPGQVTSLPQDMKQGIHYKIQTQIFINLTNLHTKVAHIKTKKSHLYHSLSSVTVSMNCWATSRCWLTALLPSFHRLENTLLLF